MTKCDDYHDKSASDPEEEELAIPGLVAGMSDDQLREVIVAAKDQLETNREIRLKYDARVLKQAAFDEEVRKLREKYDL